MTKDSNNYRIEHLSHDTNRGDNILLSHESKLFCPSQVGNRHPENTFLCCVSLHVDIDKQSMLVLVMLVTNVNSPKEQSLLKLERLNFNKPTDISKTNEFPYKNPAVERI